MSSDSSSDLEDHLNREENRTPSSSLTRLLRKVFRHPGPLFLGMTMVVLGTSALLLEPRMIGYIIDEGIVPRRLDRLRFFGLVFILSTCVRTFSAVKQGFFFELLGQR